MNSIVDKNWIIFFFSLLGNVTIIKRLSRTWKFRAWVGDMNSLLITRATKKKEEMATKYYGQAAGCVVDR